MNKVLKVMQNPCVSDSWFEEIYWIGQPVPVKMTCSS